MSQPSDGGYRLCSRKCEHILHKVKSRYWSTPHKYRLELSKSMTEALQCCRLIGEWRRTFGGRQWTKKSVMCFLHLNLLKETMQKYLPDTIPLLTNTLCLTQKGPYTKGQIGGKRQHDQANQGGNICICREQRHCLTLLSLSRPEWPGIAPMWCTKCLLGNSKQGKDLVDKVWQSIGTRPGQHLGQAACFLGSRGMQLLEWRKHKLLGMLMKEEQLPHQLVMQQSLSKSIQHQNHVLMLLACYLLPRKIF